MSKLYKILSADGRSCHGGDFEWSLPRGSRPGKWTPWVDVEPCKSGYQNVHLGVSAEDQSAWDERVPWLLGTPAAVRWVSAEPLLGPIDVFRYVFDREAEMRRLRWLNAAQADAAVEDTLDWIVVGGESGPGARPFNVAWARSIIANCRAAEVPVFIKQLGRFVVDRNDAAFACVQGDDDPAAWPESVTPDDVEHNIRGHREDYQGAPVRIHLRDRKGDKPYEWPADLRVRQYPGARHG